MSGIKEFEKLNIRQMEGLKRRQDREIQGMETGHQKYKTELAKAHNAEIVDLREQNHLHVDAENAKKEKVLEDLRSHLQHTERMTDKQLKDLKDMSAKERNETQIKLAQDRARISTENELYLDELNHRLNELSKRTNAEGQSQINDMVQKKDREYSDTQTHFQKKLNDTTNEFTARFQQEAKHQQKLKDDAEKYYKKERMVTNQRQQFEMAKMTQQHTGSIELKDNNYRKGLKEQEKFFETKYASSLETKNDELKGLEERHQKVLNRMKGDLSVELKKTVNRSEDPFYQFTELRPQMTQYPDRVEISVSIPEYAKQDLQLTTNNKDAILNFGRRYSDSNKSADGMLNKVNKVESFTTRLTADAFLDPKSVKYSYADGVMTYVIKKA